MTWSASAPRSTKARNQNRNGEIGPPAGALHTTNLNERHCDMNEPMTQDDAVKLDNEIRATFAAIWDNLDALTVLIQQAIEGQVHVALGYRSTAAYLKDVLAGQPALGSKKDRDRRAQVIALLRSAGMTQKDIGTTLGIGVATVNREIPIGNSGQPDSIESADGKKRPATYKKRQPKPEAETADDTIEVIDGEIVDDEIFYDIDDSDDPKTALDHQQDIARLTMKLDNAKRVLLDALKITQDLYQYDASIKTIIDGYVPTLREIIIAIEATAIGTDLEEGLAALLAAEQN